MIISDLPIEIQEVVFLRQEEQGNDKDKNISLDNDRNQGNFNWDESTEGYDFWADINCQNYLEFYEKYPKEYKCLPFPKDKSLYCKAKVVKDILKKDILTVGSLPDIIPAGSITWFYINYKEIILKDKVSTVCPEDNRYSADIPAEYFEIIEDEKSNELPYINGNWYIVTDTLNKGNVIKYETESHHKDYIGFTEGFKEKIYTWKKGDWCFGKCNLEPFDINQYSHLFPKDHELYKPEVKQQSMEEIQAECKRRFPIGCKYESTASNPEILKNDDVVYKIIDEDEKKQIYAHYSGGLLYENGKYAKLISLPKNKYELKENQYYHMNYDGDCYITKIKSIDEYNFEEYGFISIRQKKWFTNLIASSDIDDICEIIQATEDQIVWWDLCSKFNKYIDFSEISDKKYDIAKFKEPQYIVEHESVEPIIKSITFEYMNIDSTTSNQSFLINKSKNSLDTTIQKVSSITIELKQKSKTIKF